MTLLDFLVLCAAVGFAALIFYKKKKKKDASSNDAPEPLSSYASLRFRQSHETLHGISIISFYYDSASSYADMGKDGTNVPFDLNCETKVNDVLKSLKADGYEPEINALSCVDRVIFYITY